MIAKRRRPAVASSAAAAADGPSARSPGIGAFLKSVEWTPSFIGLMIYVWVIHSFKLPIAAHAVVGAAIGLLLQSYPIKTAPFLNWFGAFIVWGLLSLAWTDYPATVWMRWQDYAKIWIIAFVAVNAVRTTQQRTLFIVWWLACFALYPVRGTIFNFLFGYGEFGRYAWNFTFANFNDMAALTLFPLAMSVAAFRADVPKFVRLSALAGIVVLPGIVLITQSRGGFLGMVVAIALLFPFLGRYKGRTLLIGGVAAVVSLSVVSDDFWDRLSMIPGLGSSEETQVTDSSVEQRALIWKVANAIIADHPVAGVGLGAYNRTHAVYAAQRSEWRFAAGPRDTHGMYHNILAEVGIIGMLLFVGMIIAALMEAYGSIRDAKVNDPVRAWQVRALRAGLIGFLFTCIFASLQKVAFIYLFLAVMHHVATSRTMIDGVSTFTRRRQPNQPIPSPRSVAGPAVAAAAGGGFRRRRPVR